MKKYIVVLILIMTSCHSEDNEPINKFYPDGSLRLKYHYSKDSGFYGECLSYYPNGKLKLKSFYVHNKKRGLEYGYYQNGKDSFIAPYVDGKLNGTVYLFDQNGRLTEENLFYNDLKNGQSYVFYENGGLQMYAFYNHLGHQSYRRTYNRDSSVQGSKGHPLITNFINDASKYGDTVQQSIWFAHPFDCTATLLFYANDSLMQQNSIMKDSIHMENRFIITGKFRDSIKLRAILILRCSDGIKKDTLYSTVKINR